MSSPAPSIVWFRRDLRVADHPALAGAAEAGPVLCVWIRDPQIIARRHHQAPNRLRFLRAGLGALDAELRELGGSLVIRAGVPEAVLPALAREVGATRVVCTREVSPLGRARDERVARALAASGVGLTVVGGDLLADPDELAGSSGNGYLVFTPFYKAWSQLPVPDRLPPPKLAGLPLESHALDLPDGEPIIPAGPSAAREAIVRFIRDGGADAYGEARDDMAADATSRLSPTCASACAPRPRSGGRSVFRASCRRDGRPTGARSAGASSTTITSCATPRSPGSPCASPCAPSAGTTTQTISRPGRRGGPATRSLTRACVSWSRQGGSTTEPG